MSLGPLHHASGVPEQVAAAQHPARCVVVIDTGGNRCGGQAGALLACPRCGTCYPYCAEHREQLLDSMAADAVTLVTCLTCRAAIAPTWLPL